MIVMILRDILLIVLSFLAGVIVTLIYYLNNEEKENKSEQIDVEFNHEAFYEFLLNTINPNEMEKYRSMFLSNGEIVN